jgi:hypothetical protein
VSDRFRIGVNGHGADDSPHRRRMHGVPIQEALRAHDVRVQNRHGDFQPRRLEDAPRPRHTLLQLMDPRYRESQP